MSIPCDRVVKVLKALCDQVGSPVAWKVQCLLERREWIELQKVRVSPGSYLDAERYWEDALVVDLLRKAEIDGGADLEALAVETFFETERHNYETNVRLARYFPDQQYLLPEEDARVLPFIGDMRKEVRRIVGALPLWLTPRFSPGATVSDSSRRATIPDKMSSHATCYQGTRDLLQFFWDSSWGRVSLAADPLIVRANIFFTVPKNSGERRGCAKEASVPVAFQLDVGRYYRERLLHTCSVDLRKGQAVHQRLARLGSLTGDWATVDLSKASDMTARQAVRLLFPGQHVTLLESLRATHTSVDGKQVRLEKFSSMGNGFTFELETVIFTALARVIATSRGFDPNEVRVYGDDIIVRTEIVDDVIGALKFLGFKPNMKKTFTKGPFRESCGGDFFNGVRVNTLKLEKLPDEPHMWISFANGLRRVSLGMPSRSRVIHRAWRLCLEALPSELRKLRGPVPLGDPFLPEKGVSDGWIHDDDESRWITRPTRTTAAHANVKGKGFVICRPIVEAQTFHSLQIRAWVPVSKPVPWKHWSPEVQLASCTLAQSIGVTPRENVSGYRFGWVDLLPNKWLPLPSQRKPGHPHPVAKRTYPLACVP